MEARGDTICTNHSEAGPRGDEVGHGYDQNVRDRMGGRDRMQSRSGDSGRTWTSDRASPPSTQHRLTGLRRGKGNVPQGISKGL